jgi:hypothetical protein
MRKAEELTTEAQGHRENQTEFSAFKLSNVFSVSLCLCG